MTAGQWHTLEASAQRTKLTVSWDGRSVIETTDEQYLDLRVDPASQALLVAEHDGAMHPVLWVAPGPGRVLYDALGHDVGAYDSAGRQELLRREVSWLLGRVPA